jgi:putative hemolysin
MVPRSEVVVLDANGDVSQALETLLDAGHSRAPVAPGGDLDETLTIAHIRDLITSDPSTKVASVGSVPVGLPESVRVLVGLRKLQQERQQMALVVDEHGGVEGIVTIEDMVEELVGEIYDETDPDLISVRYLADGSILIPGSFPIHDLVDLGIEVPEANYTTVAGLILSRLSRVPRVPGDTVQVGQWAFEVTKTTGRRITEVVVKTAHGTD